MVVERSYSSLKFRRRPFSSTPPLSGRRSGTAPTPTPHYPASEPLRLGYRKGLSRLRRRRFVMRNRPLNRLKKLVR
jgi:hypothetical protein